MQGLGKLFFIFFKIGALTFGGGYAMLPIIYRELCENNDYFSEEDMGEIIVISQTLPGVMAVNCATQVGNRLYGKFGAMICSLAVVLPSYLIIVFLANLILKYSDNVYVNNAFVAIRAVVGGMIVAAAVKMFKPISKNKLQIIIMLGCIVISLAFKINAIYLIIIGGIIGYVLNVGGKSK